MDVKIGTLNNNLVSNTNLVGTPANQTLNEVVIQLEFKNHMGEPINATSLKVRDNVITNPYDITETPTTHRIGSVSNRGLSGSWVLQGNLLNITNTTTYDNLVTEMRNIELLELATEEWKYSNFVFS